MASGFEHGGIAVLGDFAFLHSGIVALISALVFKRNVKVFVLENRISAITGGQQTPVVSDLVGALCRNYGISYKIVNAIEMGEKSFENLLRATKQLYRGPSCRCQGFMPQIQQAFSKCPKLSHRVHHTSNYVLELLLRDRFLCFTNAFYIVKNLA